jgi:predicted ester cyclase
VSAEENAVIVRRLVESMNAGSTELLEELFDPAVINHTPRQQGGLEGIHGPAAMIWGAFPDLRVTIDLLVAEADRVAIRFTARGTHRRLAILDAPPTGREVCWTGTDIFRLAKGKIVEAWITWDTLALLSQIGAVREPRRAGS